MATLPLAHGKPVRRNELDWLRTFAVLGLIPFHAAVIFTTGSMDYVKNAETSRGVDVFVAFISTWGMPLIFLIAGAGARFALQVRTPPHFVRERFTRLVIPFLVGMLAVVPLQVYISRIARGTAPAFLPFYGNHVAMLLRIFTGVIPPSGADFIGHLWFIPMLILFEALVLSLDGFFRAGAGQRLLQFIATHVRGMGFVALFGLPFGVAQFIFRGSAALDPEFQSVSAWSLCAQFLLAYLAGYVIYADSRLERSARAVGPRTLLLACLASSAAETLQLTNLAPRPAMTLTYAAYALLTGYTSWLWVVAILSYGMRFLTQTNGLLHYLNEAAYPAYVLHMPILSLIALYVVRWPLPLLAKLLLIALATLAATLALYDLLVRRIGIMRRLFGLKLRPPGKPPSLPPIDAPRTARASHVSAVLERP
ncbi:MAG TPA: acyltransferase [Ktedonobacterales bacterium]